MTDAETRGREGAAQAAMVPPNPRLARPVRWRWNADRSEAEVWVDGQDRWVRQRAWSGDVLECLEAGFGYTQMVERVQKRLGAPNARWAARITRNYLYNLHRTGQVAMDFEPPPAVFGGRYETLRELGRGGVGVAWLARDRQTGREVVVKRAWGYFNRIENADAHVRREAQAIRAFDHPGIVRYVAEFEEGGLLHLVRAYVDGRDLTTQGKLEPGEAARVARAIADTVAHIHARGYLMLDLRPANFLLAPPGHDPVLLDVGLCTRIGSGTVEFPRPVGSPGFASPEMERAHRATVRSDVWGFGRLLFFLATGTLPRRGWGAREIGERMGTHPMRRLVENLAADDPQRRIPDMVAVLRRL